MTDKTLVYGWEFCNMYKIEWNFDDFASICLTGSFDQTILDHIADFILYSEFFQFSWNESQLFQLKKGTPLVQAGYFSTKW